MPFDTLGLQHNVRRNAEDIQNMMADLNSWEDSIRTRDQKLRKGDLNPTYKKMKEVPPVRKKGFAEMVPSGMPGPKDEERKQAAESMRDAERIQPKNYQEYKQWDKLEKNIDKWESEFDEQDRQEQEARHRQAMLDERRAIELKEAAARKKIDDAEALKQLGNALLKSGDLAGALDKYTQAVTLDPGNYVAWANSAHVRLELGQIAEAVRDCDKALEREPRYVKALLRRAKGLERLPPRERPTEPFQAAAAYDGSRYGYVFQMGELGLGYYLDNKLPNDNVERATNDLRQVLRLEPNNAQALKQLETMAPALLTPKQLESSRRKAAEAEAKAAAEAAAAAEKEKERRRRDRGVKKMVVREVDDGPDQGVVGAAHGQTVEAVAPAGDSAACNAPGGAGILEVPEMAGEGAGVAVEKGGALGAAAEAAGGENGGGRGKVVSLEEAKAVAAAARQAVEERISKLDVQVPTNSGEFKSNWKRVRGDADALHGFLSRIPPSKLPALFRAEVEEEVLVSILGNIETHFAPQAAVDLLAGLSTVRSLKTTLKFLGKAERELLSRVLARLRAAGLQGPALTNWSLVEAAFA